MTTQPASGNPPDAQRGWRGASPLSVLLVAMIGTFVLTRASLSLRPNADVNIAGYNIHHLYTGVIIITICCIPLAVGRCAGMARQLLVAGLGVGLALALDEVVYLITTNGTNAAYLTRISWIGGIVLIVMASAYACVVGRRK